LAILAIYNRQTDNLIKALPWKPDVAAWTTLLGACTIHGNVEMAERVAKWALELEREMLQVMFCYQMSMQSRGRNGV